MWVNIFSAEDYYEEAQLKVVLSLTVDDLIKQLKQGEVLSTEWLLDRSHDAEFRVIIQGRRIGVGNDERIIDLHDGGPKVRLA